MELKEFFLGDCPSGVTLMLILYGIERLVLSHCITHLFHQLILYGIESYLLKAFLRRHRNYVNPLWN